MKRQRLSLWILALALMPSVGMAGELINFADHYELGDPITSAIGKAGKGADLNCVIQQVVTLPGGIEVLGVQEAATILADGQIFAWAKPGKYRAVCTAAAAVDGKPKLLRDIDTFTVGDAPPGPVPPGPVPPGPTPPDPTPPAPGTLGALVPDPAHRALLAEFYSDMATVVRSGSPASTGEFYAGQRKAVADAQAAGKLPTGLGAISKPISDRITAALGGTADVPLDAAKRTTLADALDSIAAEFR